MTLYLGRAANSPEEVAKAKEALTKARKDLADFHREWPAQNPLPPWSEDDGRGDEAHPDSSWVSDFNRGQRGET